MNYEFFVGLIDNPFIYMLLIVFYFVAVYFINIFN
jgi:hypothetical protein